MAPTNESQRLNQKMADDLGKLVLISADDPSTAQAANFFVKQLESMPEFLRAVSLELPPGMQLLFDKLTKETAAGKEAMVESDDFFGYAYAINYALKQKIPIYASDLKHDKYLARVGLVTPSQILGQEGSPRALIERASEANLLADERASATYGHLQNILGLRGPVLAHIGSLEQARRIKSLYLADN